MAPASFSFSPAVADCSRKEESALIRAEMLHIEATSEQPRRLAQYLDLCKRQNATISTICSLPLEILYTIFRFTAEDYRRFHLTLRLVSTLWNAVVQASPHLWTYIALNEEFREKDKSFLKLCLRYSGEFHLNTFLRFNRHTLHPPPFYDILKNELHRIRSLSLVFPAAEWLPLIPKCRHLISLRICGYASPYLSLSLPDGNLTHVFLALHLRDLHFGSSKTSMTHVDLSGVPIDICVQFLVQCPNLVEFMCNDATPSRSKLDILPHIELNHLSSLWWVIDNDPDWDDFLPEYIYAPALESLTWGIDRFSPTRASRLSAPSLKEVHFIHMGYDSAESTNPMDHLCRDANIEAVSLSCCSKPFVLAAISALKPTGEGVQKTIFFPNLTEIYVSKPRDMDVRLDPSQNHLISDIGDIFVEVLEGRKAFLRYFKFVAWNDFEWSKDIWRRLKKLEDDGIELTVLHNSKQIDISSQL